MKFLLALSFIVVLLGLAQGQLLDINCASEPLVIGPCENRMSGYSYSDLRKRCVNFSARGCDIAGNFFYSRAECEHKCKPIETFEEAPFSFFLERIRSQARNYFSQLFDLP